MIAIYRKLLTYIWNNLSSIFGDNYYILPWSASGKIPFYCRNNHFFLQLHVNNYYCSIIMKQITISMTKHFISSIVNPPLKTREGKTVLVCFTLYPGVWPLFQVFLKVSNSGCWFKCLTGPVINVSHFKGKQCGVVRYTCDLCPQTESINRRTYKSDDLLFPTRPYRLWELPPDTTAGGMCTRSAP